MVSFFSVALYNMFQPLGNLDNLLTDKSNLIQPHQKILSGYLAKVGPLGIDTLRRTCTVQVR